MVVDSPVRNSFTPATAKNFTLENCGGLSSQKFPHSCNCKTLHIRNNGDTLQLESPSLLLPAPVKHFTEEPVIDSPT
jgi:hypothetical protein